MKVEEVFSDRALMIDNETFALGPNAYITQVGLAPPETEYKHDAAVDAGWQMEYLFNLVHRLHYCLGAGEAARWAEL